jgi:hypothetical protein
MPMNSPTPSQPGWYWVQNQANPTPTIVYVNQVGYGASTITPALVVQNWTLDGTESWQGPLQPN